MCVALHESQWQAVRYEPAVYLFLYVLRFKAEAAPLFELPCSSSICLLYVLTRKWRVCTKTEDMPCAFTHCRHWWKYEALNMIFDIYSCYYYHYFEKNEMLTAPVLLQRHTPERKTSGLVELKTIPSSWSYFTKLARVTQTATGNGLFSR